MDTEWILKLKVGDRVIIDRHLQSTAIARVFKLTPKQIVTHHKVDYGTGPREIEERFWIKDGYGVGSDRFSRFRIEEATPEALAKIAHDRLAVTVSKRMSQIMFSKVSVDVLEKLNALIEPYVKKEEN